MKHSFALTLLCAAALSLPAAGQSNTTSSSSTVSNTNASSSTTAAAQTPGGVQTATSLLPVPTYAAADAFQTATASGLAVNLPGYTYNLTSESLATRTGICNQTTAFCASSACTSSAANVTVNFCNVETMGWNCECNEKAESRLQPVTVPVNSFDCKLRTSACLTACQNPFATPPISSISNCQTACTYVLGSTCGTGSQAIPLYKVDKFDDIPKYYADTSVGGVAQGITTAGAPGRGPFAVLLLGAIGGAVMVLR